MIRFYAPDITSTRQLPESDSGHCIRVLRMNAGDEIEVTDGHGMLYRCRLADTHSKHTAVEIIESTPLPPVWNERITIAVAPTKHLDRMEWMVEKLVEIGVNRIVPLLCRRSERREIKIERLEKIAVAAMKQSLKATLPAIDPMTPIGNFIADSAVSGSQLFMGYCDASTERRLMAREYIPGRNVTVMIGPEGDFTPEEVSSAISAGFIPMTLGDNRLRTETAAVVACDTVHIKNQIFT